MTITTSSPAKQNFRLQLLVTIAGTMLFIVKMIAWQLTQSVSILSDALESTVNVAAGFISLYSLYIAAKPRDEDHPYGHGKAEFVSAAVEGSLISIAGLLIIYKSILTLNGNGGPEKLDSGILLIMITAVTNYLLGLTCVRAGKKRHSLALIASGKHLQSDSYSTFGIVVGLVIIYFTGWSVLDPIIASVFALFIIYTGYTIIRSSIEGIMDKADTELLDQLVRFLNQKRRDNWIDLHNVRIIKFGTVLHLDAHLTVPWFLNVHEAHDEVDELSRLIRMEFGESLELFIHTDGCLDFSCTICSKTECAVRKHPQRERIEWTVENIISNSKHR